MQTKVAHTFSCPFIWQWQWDQHVLEIALSTLSVCVGELD